MARHSCSGTGAASPAPLGMTTGFPVPAQRRARSSVTRGRIVIAAVAAGAFAAAGAGQYAHGLTGDAGGSRMTLAAGTEPAGSSADTGGGETGGHGVGGALSSPDVLLSAHTADPSDAAADLAHNQRAISTVEAEHAEAARPKFVRPGTGDYTSGFEARWGTFHYGIDLSAPMRSPIYAAADGEIIEAGPASGFGLWVRERLDDGSTLVYGHMHDFSVHAGQRVKAGDQIARVGQRGQSTGPHLHFELWDPSGKKIDPKPWLEDHGIDV